MEPPFYTVNGIINRRIHLRNECLIRIDIEDAADNAFKGIVRNISPDGAYIECRQPLLTKRRELTMTIPFQTKPGSKSVVGKVVWVTDKGVGIQFAKG